MQADREGGEDGLAVGRRIAVERLAEMFEAGRGGDAMARQQRQLRRALRQTLKGGHAVGCSDFANFVHTLIDVERRQAGGGALDIGDAFAQLPTRQFDRIASHSVAKVTQSG